MLFRTYIALMRTFHMKENVNLRILATSDIQFLYPIGSSGSKFEPLLRVYLAL